MATADPRILRELERTRWRYAEGDLAALRELRERIDAIGGAPEKFLTYTELVDGLEFKLANVNGGTPHRIGAWDELDRALIGDFLGRLVVDSYREGGFFVSALVVSAEERTPGKGFYDLARQVSALKSKDKYVELEFWMKHVNAAREWYSSRAT